MLKTILALAGALALAPAFAGPLTSTTAIHTHPSDTSPTISFLGAGTSPTPAPGATAPAGWMAVELAGAHEGYVQNKDLLKSLDVTPGASIYLGPKTDSGVLAIAQAGDKTTITGLQGRWTQINLEKKLIGYLHVSGEVPTNASVSPSANYVAASPPAPATRAQPMATSPINPVATGVAEAGRAAPVVSLSDSGVSLPRQFQGQFVSTRSLLKPRRPFDWALDDDAGKRFAYLDVSKLLQTEQIEKYAGHHVVVYGPVRPLGNGQDIVVTVESLQLR